VLSRTVAMIGKITPCAVRSRFAKLSSNARPCSARISASQPRCESVGWPGSVTWTLRARARVSSSSRRWSAASIRPTSFSRWSVEWVWAISPDGCSQSPASRTRTIRSRSAAVSGPQEVSAVGPSSAAAMPAVSAAGTAGWWPAPAEPASARSGAGADHHPTASTARTPTTRTVTGRCHRAGGRGRRGCRARAARKRRSTHPPVHHRSSWSGQSPARKLPDDFSRAPARRRSRAGRIRIAPRRGASQPGKPPLSPTDSGPSPLSGEQLGSTWARNQYPSPNS
jgi:hypothetical protein